MVRKIVEVSLKFNSDINSSHNSKINRRFIEASMNYCRNEREVITADNGVKRNITLLRNVTYLIRDRKLQKKQITVPTIYHDF